MILTSFDVGRKNLACCVYDNTARTILFWHIFDLGDRCRGTGVHREMYRQFDDAWDSLGRADVVLVERQPRTNPQMRVIEAIVEAYFVLKGKRCVDYSSRHKLGRTLDSSVNTYAARKRASVDLTNKFLQETAADEGVMAIWRASKKKDDLGDALLQACSYRGDLPPPDESLAEAELTRKVPRREPADKRNHLRKLYTRSQVKWFFSEWLGEKKGGNRIVLPEHDDTLALRFESMLDKSSRVKRSVERLWPDLDACIRQMLM